MTSAHLTWQSAAAQPGLEPYASFVSGRLIEDLTAGRLRGTDGVVLALRLTGAGAVDPVLAAALAMSPDARAALQAGPKVWPVALSASVLLKDLPGIVALAATVADLILVDVSQVLPADTMAMQVAAAPALSPIPCNAIVAIIDDGLALGHGRFRDDAGNTRIAAAWAMDGASAAAHDHGYGRVYSGAEIDTLIADATQDGRFDDERFMRLSGLVDHSRDIEETVARSIAHGTAVLDLMAGYSAQDGIADAGGPLTRDAAATAPIIAVQFPSAQARDLSGAGLRPFVRDALQFVLDRADAISGDTPVPVVINLSYGLVAGPHDGTQQIERDIRALLGARDHVHLVLPSGNSALSRSHARVTLGAGQSVALDWQVYPDDHTPSFVEIWPRAADGAELEVRLETPDGAISGPVSATHPRQVLEVGGDVLADLVHGFYPEVGQRHGVLAALSPTFDLEARRRIVPGGIWRLHVLNTGTSAMAVDVWVQRDVGPSRSNLRGRQSTLEDAAYQRFDEIGDMRDRDAGFSVITREGTVSAMATMNMKNVHVVGGWIGGDDRRPAPYSSRTLDEANGPRMAAQSETSRAHRGQLAAGTGSSATAALGGTSVAAPQYARALVSAVLDNTGVAPDVERGTYVIKPGVVAEDGMDRVGPGTIDPVHRARPARRRIV